MSKLGFKNVICNHQNKSFEGKYQELKLCRIVMNKVNNILERE